MLQILLKNLKIVSFAGSAISILSVVRTVILTAVIMVFALQIFTFVAKEKMQTKS